jgi:membrane-associated phospholipid phosphatase
MAAVVPAGALCNPEWYINTSSTCPYGRNLTGDLTLPNDANFFDLLMVLYGYMPYLVILGGFVALCWYRGTSQLVFLMFGGLVVFLGELIWKPLLGAPRPIGSCVFTCGMPSSHATISIGFLTWMLLEGILRKQLSRNAIFAVELEPPRKPRERSESYWEDDPPVARITRKQRVKWVVAWLVVLFPVPFSRVALMDHSWAQITAGSFIGCFEALLFYFLLNRFGAYLDVFLLERCCLMRNGKTCGLCSDPFFHNNYEPNHYIKRNTLVRANRALAKNSRAAVVPSEVDETKTDEPHSPYAVL